jgi:AbiV family abortive infection protein
MAAQKHASIYPSSLQLRHYSKKGGKVPGTSKPAELKAIAWRGPLTPALAANGINAAIRNARRLLNDATTLYNIGGFPSATALGILAIEEYGKVNIIHQILLAKTDSARRKVWREYTSHTAKNTAWVMPNLVKPGARSVDDFRMLFERERSTSTSSTTLSSGVCTRSAGEQRGQNPRRTSRQRWRSKF